ncbi:hypothetical protein Pcac1_g29364 [Phytophthora cactorum]|nr:hypothetical protein Pcac1_g29364 [Phytophthora cactorum]
MTSGKSKYKGRQAQKTSSACHYCGEHGHWIAKCPVRIRENAGAAEARNERMSRRVKTTLATSSFRLEATRMSPSSSGMWLVDSGATQHMTYSKEYMKNFKKITPVDVASCR